MLHLGCRGPLATRHEQDGGPLRIWRRWAGKVQGQAMKGGHFFSEENPTETAEILDAFPSA
jgi:haloacetate dehalogenase